MEIQTLTPQSPYYPAFLHGQNYSLRYLGNPSLLNPSVPLLAFFCSLHCPSSLMPPAYALAQALRDAQISVISGFHSPMEQASLTLLLQGTQPILYCPARGLGGMRISKPLQAALEGDRLLLLSPFVDSLKRASATTAQRRNKLVGAIAQSVFIAHATPDGKTAALAASLVAAQKPVYTFDHPDTQNLVQVGVRAIAPEKLIATCRPQCG